MIYFFNIIYYNIATFLLTKLFDAIYTNQKKGDIQ